MRNENKVTNARGEYIECAFYRNGKCSALREWYNLKTENEHCLECPFFKTVEQYETEKIIYPYRNYYDVRGVI